MRILQVAPFVAPLDEHRAPLGGAQVLVADLAMGLSALGHEVTLAAAMGSRLAGVRVAELGVHAGRMRAADLGPRDAARADDDAQRDAFARVRAWLDRHRDQIDVVHAHAYDAPAFDALRGSPRPVVHTLHLPPHDATVVRAARETSDARLVAVSQAGARSWRAAGVAVTDVIHNGIDIARIRLSSHRGSHLLCAGRLSPEKGVETAIEVARRLERGLVIVGGIYDQGYFDRAIAPHVRAVAALDPDAPVREPLYLGPRPRVEVHLLMGGAAATLMPIHWDEPFGLVAVESLAAGTPVVAYRRGALPEIIQGPTGALAPPEDVAAFARAVTAAIGSDPGACRAQAERFGLPPMVARYLEVYAALTGTAPRGPGVTARGPSGPEEAS